MAYCPQCGMQYREGTAECVECEEPLEPGKPPQGFVPKKEEPSKLVRIRVFSGPSGVMAADLARNLLASEGIPCMLPGEFTAEMLPGIDPVQVVVRECDAERANEILHAYFDKSEPEPAR